MRSIIFSLAILAIVFSSSLFAQRASEYRSTSSGIWSDYKIWENDLSGVWLVPSEGVYPGESHNRKANVVVSDGSTVTIDSNDVVQISSLAILQGEVIVNGTLIIGDAINDPDEPSFALLVKEPISSDEPQLQQNFPNPLSPQSGYETTIRFYLDGDNTHARVAIYDQLSHLIILAYEEQLPIRGWHSVKVRLDGVRSGTYPVLLELPNKVIQKMISVLR